MVTFTAVLLAATFGYALALRLLLPPFPFLMLGGLLLSRSGLVTDPTVFQDYLLLGLSFLVFSSGMELSPRRAGSQAKAALMVGIVQFLALGGAGLGLGYLFGFQGKELFYLAVALAASSTLVVVRLLQRRRQLFEPFGRLVVGVLLVQDLLVVLSAGALHKELTTGLVGVIALLLFTFVFARYLGPLLILRYQDDEETLLLVTLSVLFVFIGLAYLGDLPSVLGAFLAGVALSEFPVDGVVRGHLKTLKTFFHALFFTCLGALISFDPEVIGQAFVLAIAVLLLTPVIVVFLAERTGLLAKAAIESGMLLSQTSEFSLVLVLIGMGQGDVHPSTFSVIVLVTVVTMLWTPSLSSDGTVHRLVRLHWTRRRPVEVVGLHDHTVVLGAGDSGAAIARELKRRGREVVVVDEDPLALEALEDDGIPVLRGDGSDPRILKAAGVAQAQLVLSTLRRLEDHLAVLRCSDGTPTWARVFEPYEAQRVQEAGGVPLLISEAAAVHFLEWFEKEKGFAGPPGADAGE